MESQRGEQSLAELCSKHAINQAIFYKWNKHPDELKESTGGIVKY